MLITMLVAAVGVHRTLRRRVPGGWVFAIAFRREAFGSPDVSYTAAATLPPSRRCRVNGALHDELLLVTGLAPVFQTNLRAEPCEALCASDASPSGTGGLRCARHTGSLARPVRLGWRQENTCAWMGKAKNRRATCTMYVQPLHHSLARRLLVLVDSRVVLGTVPKRRSSSRKINFLLRNKGSGASRMTSHSNWY